jgi:hypothetical protein
VLTKTKAETSRIGKVEMQGFREALDELPSLWRRVVAGDVLALDSERKLGRRSSTLKSTN